MQTRRGELVEALTLAADILRNPAFPESEFEQFRLQAVTGLEASRKEPGNIAGAAMAKAFDPWPADHPLRHRDIDQSLAEIKALTLEQVVPDLRDFLMPPLSALASGQGFSRVWNREAWQPAA